MANIVSELARSLESLFDGRPVPNVRAIHRPPGGSAESTSPFTLVVLDVEPTVVGLCYDLLEDDDAKARYDALDLAAIAAEGDALALAKTVVSSEPELRVVGYAACHALSQMLFSEARAASFADSPWRETTGDVIERLDPNPSDHVGLVGYAPPMVGSLLDAGARRLIVFERPERARQLRDRAPEGVVISTDPSDFERCDKVLLTSTSILNGTFDDVAERTAKAEFRALYGPGASVLPTPFLERGFDAMAGLVVTDGDVLIERQLAGQRWGDARRKVLFVKA